jgi:hypothetical protein
MAFVQNSTVSLADQVAGPVNAGAPSADAGELVHPRGQ